MKIFLISNLYPSKEDLDYGIFVKNIEEQLIDNGAVISHKAVIAGRAKSFWDKVKKYKKFCSEIISEYRKDDFDIIYLHFISHSSPWLFLAKSLFGKKKKFVVNVHGSDVLKYNKGLLKWCNQNLLDATDLLVVPSTYFKRVVNEVFPNFPEDKIFISPSGGIDLTLFNFKEKPLNQKLHLGFVSRIEDDKGWNTFLNALLILKTKGVPFKASIAGTGTKVEEMKTRILNCDLENEVSYLKILSHTELAHLYKNLDLFIFPTKSSESLGLVGVEAMACGVPVIGTEIGGLKTFIEDGKNGFFFSPGNEKDLVDKIQSFHKMTLIQKMEMGNAARQTAKKYDRVTVVADLYRRFEQLLTNHR